jgi:hypothetical protein
MKKNSMTGMEYKLMEIIKLIYFIIELYKDISNICVS